MPQEKAAIEKRGTENADAYNLYLMARAYRLTGNTGDPRYWEASERLMRRAVEIDRGYARAWTLMALAQHNLRRSHGRSNDGGKAALDRALDLNPDLVEACALKAWNLSLAGLNAEASAKIAAAMQLDPESYEVNEFAGYISYEQGRFNDAARYWEKAAALVDTDIRSPFMLVSCYLALNDVENARRTARVALGRAEKAIAADQTNGYAMGVGVAALGALGETDRAKEWMNRALLIDPNNLTVRYNFACALATSLGDHDAALDMLEVVLENDPGGLVGGARKDPDFASLRGHPRFQAMMAAAEARLAKAAAGEA
jgi:adenylate cyclase